MSAVKSQGHDKNSLEDNSQDAPIEDDWLEKEDVEEILGIDTLKDYRDIRLLNLNRCFSGEGQLWFQHWNERNLSFKRRLKVLQRRLECGHTCVDSCHANNDPDHENYLELEKVPWKKSKICLRIERERTFILAEYTEREVKFKPFIPFRFYNLIFLAEIRLERSPRTEYTWMNGWIRTPGLKTTTKRELHVQKAMPTT